MWSYTLRGWRFCSSVRATCPSVIFSSASDNCSPELLLLSGAFCVWAGEGLEDGVGGAFFALGEAGAFAGCVLPMVEKFHTPCGFFTNSICGFTSSTELI